jgi:hypothetical protein
VLGPRVVRRESIDGYDLGTDVTSDERAATIDDDGAGAR